jgi:parallel beta-helix repeat protein
MKKAFSEIMLILLILNALMLKFNFPTAKGTWTGTVYIKADGSIYPRDAPLITSDNITYTLIDNITSPGDGIVVERDNVTIDGFGHMLQGTQAYYPKGIGLTGRSNVTIKNVAIIKFEIGVYLDHSSYNRIIGNQIKENSKDGVLLDHSFDNSITGNNITENNGHGISLYSSNYNNVTKNNIITNNWHGIYLDSSSEYNNMAGNNIVANNFGIALYSSSKNNIAGNNMANNNFGVYVVNSSDNSITGNNITDNNQVGIALYSLSKNNAVIRNNITDNNYGISLDYSSKYNKIVGNNVMANTNYGIYLDYSSSNTFCHNNFIDNAKQVYTNTYSYTNFWDYGYPSGGNYWSDYRGVDEKSGPNQDKPGGDGIGDSSQVIDGNNVDKYPLMAPITTFDAYVWTGQTYSVDIVSNSSISNFKLDATQKTLSFTVTGIEGKAGFCRVTIPNIIIQYLWQGNYTVLLNGEPWPFTSWTDIANNYIYFNYTHSEHEIVIIPEFPSTMILPQLMLTTLIAMILLKKKRKTKF